MMLRLLVFHKAIAPYRIDFFNSLNEVFEMRICPFSDHMTSQPFNHEKLKRFFSFEPVYLNQRHHIGIAKIPKGIVRQIKEFDPDIILENEFGISVILILLYKFLCRKKYKVVTICDDSYNQIVERNDFRWAHRLARKIVTPFLDEVVLIEPEVVEWYRKHYGKGIFFPIIRNEGILRRQYESLASNNEQIRKYYQIEGKYVFLFVGRLVTIKNVGLLINAFSELDQKDSVLVIVGDGPEKKNLQKLATSCKEKIVFTGRLEGSDLFAWYNVADCFILPSTIEPFGAVINEALLAGCWCLVSNRAGSRCLIDEGKNGYTFDPTNIADLTKKMNKSIHHTSSKAKGFRKSRMVYNYQDLFANLVGVLYKMGGERYAQRKMSFFVKLARLLPDKLYLSLKYYKVFGRFPNWKKPQTFSEKLQWLKLYDRRQEYTTMVDKYAVKKYVADIIGEEYIIPTLGVWEKPEDIEWERLPNQFVLKTTHGGGGDGVVICKDKKSFDMQKAICQLYENLKTDLYVVWREWPYKNVPKRIIAEEYIRSKSCIDELIDYKFFCFHGEPEYCQVISGRYSKMCIDFFDKNWNHLPFHEPKIYPHADREPLRPRHFDQMWQAAATLSAGTIFSRIDFYDVNDKVFFSEITFFPTSGMGGFDPEEWDNIFGKKLFLPQT